MKRGTTYGNAGLFQALVWLLRYIPIRVFYAFESVCVIPFTLIFSSGARITYRYFHDILGWGRWASIAGTYRNHCIFGKTVIDKFAMYAGHKFRVKYHGLEEYMAQMTEDKAVLQLNAHVGCSEILGYSCHADKPCNVLVFGGEKESLMAYRRSSFGDMNIKMISVGTGENNSDEIVGALDRGEIVCAFADRFFNERKIVRSSLHGHPIRLARGPFSLAVTRGIDVFMVSAMKERDGSYTAFFTPLHYDRTLTAKEQRQQLADAYCAEIERLLGMYPTQWFNYFNPWADNA